MGISPYILAQLESRDHKHEKSFRGQSRTYTDEQIQFITSKYTEYEKERKKVKIAAFMRYLKQQWKKQSWLTPTPSRKTVEDTLLANGFRKPNSRAYEKSSYYEPVKKYFPHVQSVMDGKQVVVHINNNQYTFVMEYSKDIATDAIGGFQVGKTESSDLVKEAFNDHSRNYNKPLSSLVDNGKGNKKAAIDLGAEGTLFINAFPRRPQTKGTIEGEFGLFERTVSHIQIKGKSKEEMALSFLENLSRLYIRLRNKTPRCSVCPFTPNKLMKANLDETEAEKAYLALKEQQEKKQKEQERRLKISDQHHVLLDSIVNEHKLKGDTLRFKRSLRWVEISTLKEAEQVFAVYSLKDNFDESKRKMAYFVAIARNLQEAKDQNRKEQVASRRYSLDQTEKECRDRIQSELSLKKEQQRLEKEPHLRLINAIKAHMNLPEDLRESANLFKKFIDESIESFLRKGKQRQKTLIEKINKGIMDLSNLSLNERYQWIEYVNERIDYCLNKKVEVVTPK